MLKLHLSTGTIAPDGKTRPVLAYYLERGLVAAIDGVGRPDDVTAGLTEVLKA